VRFSFRLSFISSYQVEQSTLSSRNSSRDCTHQLSGSEDQRPDLASLSEELIKKQTGCTIRMKELEGNILFKLASSAEGDITEDVALMENFEETKNINDDIE